MSTTRQEMETFLWEGKDRRGKKLKGERTGRNEMVVKAELRQQGIVPGRVRRKPKPLFGGAGKPVKAKDIASFTRQLATMMAAGLPPVNSFNNIIQYR